MSFLILPTLFVDVVLAQQFHWAKRAGGSQRDYSSDIHIDAAGNSYVTGTFEGTAAFGAGEIGETVLTSSGDLDVFVAKYNSTGSLVWAKRAGGAEADRPGGIAVDPSGNSYVTGTFLSVATFGAGEINQATLTSAGGHEVFLAMYSSSGALVWAKRAGGFYDDGGAAIAIDAEGNSYVTGSFGGSDFIPSAPRFATFGPGETNQTILNAAGLYGDIFLAKYDQWGALVWAKQAASAASAYDIALDPVGNSYLTGQFEGSATFGPGLANETKLSSVDNVVFVAKYGSGGTLLWVKQAGEYALGLGIGIDTNSDVYVTGLFGGTDFFRSDAVFGRGEATETTLNGQGNGDMFLAKYKSDGGFLWAKGAGGTQSDSGTGIVVDGAGNVSVAGPFADTVTFGPGEANEVILTSPQKFAAFIAKYDSNGRLISAKSNGRTGNDGGGKIAVDPAGNVYVTGGFAGTMEFGTGDLRQTTLTSAGTLDIFIARYLPAAFQTTSLALPQLAFGGGWLTTLNFSNSTGSVASVQLRFVADGGSPLDVPLTGLGTMSSRTINLSPGGTSVLQTATAGDLVTGWVEALVPAGVNGYAVFRQSAPDSGDHEAVVPLSPTSSQTVELIYDDTGSSVTATAFLNPGNQPVPITITAFSQDGAQIGSTQLVLDARSKQAAMLRELPGLGATAGTRGRAVFSVLSGTVSVLGLRFVAGRFAAVPVVHR